MKIWDWLPDWLADVWPLLVLPAALIALIGGLVWISAEREKRWQSYAAEHHCVEVGTKASSVVIGVDGKSGIDGEQTIYRCDDGEMQIR